MKRTKKIISLLMAMLIIIGTLPVSALAVDASGRATSYSVYEAIIRNDMGDDVTNGEHIAKIDSVICFEFMYSDNYGNEMYAPSDMVVWESEDPSVVSVEEYGKLAMVSEGSSYVTGKYTDDRGNIYIASTTVIVEGYADDEVVNIAIYDIEGNNCSFTTVKAIVGETLTFSAKAVLGNGSEVDILDVEWTGSSPTVLTVDENGNVTVNSIYRASVECRYTDINGNVFSSFVSIDGVDPEYVEVDHLEIYAPDGSNVTYDIYETSDLHSQFRAVAVFVDGTSRQVDANWYIMPDDEIEEEFKSGAYVTIEGKVIPSQSCMAYIQASYTDEENVTTTAHFLYSGAFFEGISDETVGEVYINGVDDLLPDCLPDYEIDVVATGCHLFDPRGRYVVNGIEWVNADTGFVFDPEEDVVEEGDEYYANVFLEVEEGYKFDFDNGITTVYVNGEPVETTYGIGGYAGNGNVADKSRYLCVRVPFTYTAEYEIVEYIEVLSIDYPEVGKAADFEPYNPGYAGYVFEAPENFVRFHNGIYWYDATDDRALEVGDVFEAEHVYHLSLVVKAKDGYRLNTDENGYPTVDVISELGDNTSLGTLQGQEGSKYCSINFMAGGNFIQSQPFVPVVYYDIDVEYCTAYNASGEEITRAQAGEKITLFADLIPPVSKELIFEEFVSKGDDSIEFTYISEDIAEFVMPESDVSIEAVFSKLPISHVSIYIDAPVAGREADFTASTFYQDFNFIYGQTGFWVCTDMDTSIFYDGVSWYDKTTGTTLKPGDIIVEGHSYDVNVIVEAWDHYGFEIGTTTGSISHLSDASVFGVYGYDETEYVCVNAQLNVPYTERSVTVTNGTAYNEAGEVVTSAAIGDIITVVGNDPTGVRTFQWWRTMNDISINFKDDFQETTKFFMPDSDVEIDAYYTDALIEGDITIALKGYYAGVNAGLLQVSANPVGVEFVPMNTTGLDYALFADSKGVPSNTEVTGTLKTSTVYWLAVKLTAAEGYDISEVNNVTLKGSTNSIINRLDDGSIVAMFQLPAPTSMLKKTITTDRCTAYINGNAVTNSVLGMKVDLVADEPAEDEVFAGWEVVSGSIVLQDYNSTTTSFVMPSTNVSVRAKYTKLIKEIAITDLVIPEVGANPDFEVTIPDDAGYEIEVSINEDAVNGSYWYLDSVGDEYVGEVLNEESVFDYNGFYVYSVYLKAKDGYEFKLNEDGSFYNVNATINGEEAMYSIIDENALGKYISVVQYFFLPEKTYDVTGKFTHFDTSGYVGYIEFYSATDGALSGSAQVVGDTYTVADMLPGDYRVKVSMENHATRYYDFTVSEESTTLDVKIHLIGDVTGDGRINSRDLNLMKSYLNRARTLDEYQVACLDVTGDGRINSRDVTKIKAHMSGNSSLWR